MAETNRFQLVVAQEDQPGVEVAAASLFVAANAKITPTTPPQMAVAPELIRREAVTPSLTPRTSLVGVTDVTLTFTTELAGTTAAGGVPDWSILLEACGWKKYGDVRSYNSLSAFGGSGGPFYAGEQLTGTGGGPAYCLFDTFDGQGKLYTFNETAALTGTITGGTSATTATFTGTTATTANAWVPVDQPESTCTVGTVTSGPFTNGEVAVGGTSGARIVLTEAWTAGAAQSFRYLSGTLTSGETVTGQDSGASAAVTVFAQTKFPTLTMAVVEDSVRRTIIGCRGTFALQVNAVGEPVAINWTFKGRVAASPETDGVAVSGVTRTGHVPPGFRGVTFLVGDDSDAYADEHTPRVQAFGVTIDGTIGVTKDATQSSGLTGAASLRTRQGTANVTVGVQAEGLFDWLAKTRNATPVRLNTILPSTKTFNSFWIHVPAFIPTSAPGQDDNGDALRNISGEISGRRPDGSEGDDRELVLAVFSADPS